jgi:hypothetical protein
MMDFSPSDIPGRLKPTSTGRRLKPTLLCFGHSAEIEIKFGNAEAA